MEIGDPIVGSIGDSGPFQILFHHQPGLPLAELGELPTDPYSGEAFRYEVGESTVRLWSARDREWEFNEEVQLAWEWER